MRKYVLVKSNLLEKARAVIVDAALISEAIISRWPQVQTDLRTTFACYDLTDFSIRGTVNIGISRRKAGYGDILRQQVELGNAIPDFTLGAKLRYMRTERLE